ncbi:MAG: threonine-phosphate decarboxylase [Stappia sp.]|uniref:threonine-phosphate decarboxylase CobD n=1 Tax=Stappia sp. TaxID=1870903 RepID=UPI000C559C22|nr:threonine-phosphate decarboxylase CobD [Stappia sp.]MAA98560.1 threonine-phosphate decarboxylase [Stappia sp.]MBM20611.1 threonine-phosphate decarboxylase [Stappia sp.]
MKHGGDLGAAMARHGGILTDWLDLSTGINPHAYPVPDDLGAHVWTALPSASALERLLSAARGAYQVPAELDLVAAPGTQSLISLLPRFLPDGEVAIIGPTYGSHADVWRRAGRVLREVTSPNIDIDPTIRVAVLVNPNNPDGRLADPKTVRHLASTLAARGGLLIVDEAFADCIPGASVLPHLQGTPALVLRSFGKFYGLAGLRLGFAAAPPRLANTLTLALESWAVSGPALAIGARALEDTEWQRAMQARLADEAAEMTVSLQMRGLGIFGGTPLFLLAGTRDAARVQEALARQRIWTRIFDYAPSWIRLGLPGGADGLARLEHALDHAMTET